jgi:hypothetical protein
VRKTRATIWVIVVVLSLSGSAARATIEFKDGQIRDINYGINDDVWIDYESPGMQTTINWLDEASLSYPYNLEAYEDSRINISGGWLGRSLLAWDRSQVDITNGSISDNLTAFDSSHVDISGGSISWESYATDNSQFDISGGSIGEFLLVDGSSQATISGGSIGTWLRALDTGQVEVSGGVIGEYLWASEDSQVDVLGGLIVGELRASLDGVMTIHGWDFAVDGQDVGYGELSSIFGYGYEDEPFRHLTGTLASFELIDNDFRIGHNAKIVLVPEPGTLLLLGLGGLAVLRKQRK